MPLLEAFACGVRRSSRTAGRCRRSRATRRSSPMPTDAEAIGAALVRVLTNRSSEVGWFARGMDRAARFHGTARRGRHWPYFVRPWRRDGDDPNRRVRVSSAESGPAAGSCRSDASRASIEPGEEAMAASGRLVGLVLIGAGLFLGVVIPLWLYLGTERARWRDRVPSSGWRSSSVSWSSHWSAAASTFYDAVRPRPRSWPGSKSNASCSVSSALAGRSPFPTWFWSSNPPASSVQTDLYDLVIAVSSAVTSTGRKGYSTRSRQANCRAADLPELRRRVGARRQGPDQVPILRRRDLPSALS